MTGADTVTPRVRAIMAEVFDMPAGDIHADSTPETLSGWNSFSHTVLIGALETEFKVEFDIDDLLELQSLGRIVAALKNRYDAR